MLKRVFLLVCLCALGSAAAAFAAANPYLGDWALKIPGADAGYLGVDEVDGKLQAGLLWGGGSVEPLTTAKIEDGKLVMTRSRTVQRREADGKRSRRTITETITATVDGDNLKATRVSPRENGQGEDKTEFTGYRQAPVPPAPELSKVKFGPPIALFNGRDLTGWRLTHPGAVNGWSVKDGILVNDPVQEEGKPHKNYGNLRTEREFEDFNLKVEVRTSKGENSGIYLRGIYEVQVADTYGRPTDAHNMGAVYSRLKPTVSAEKPPGQWQTLDITLVDRHATVILNGTKIIDNQPIRGCTGGALWSDVNRPGPIYIQGDHTGIEYRSLVLRPVLK